MYAIIDLTNLRFVYAHQNCRLLSSLAHIELSEVGTLVCDASYQGTYGRFTDMELKLLYRNTFGVDSIFNRGAVIQVIMDNAADLPQVDADPYEALMQANTLGDDDEGFYRYQKGALVPEELDEAFTYVPLRMKHIPLGAPKRADGALMVGRDYSGAPAGPTAAPPAADRPTVGTVPAPRPAAAPSAPRQGGATATIWSVADAMWEAAGKPTSLPVVLALRKQIMNELEAKHNVKKTTSSTSLGNWQKVRLP